MTVLAIETAFAVLAWVGLVVGLVVLAVVVTLFTRVVKPTLEIRRYSKEILDAGLAIARNLDGVDELERTQELGGKVPQLGGAYIERLGASTR